MAGTEEDVTVSPMVSSLRRRRGAPGTGLNSAARSKVRKPSQ